MYFLLYPRWEALAKLCLFPHISSMFFLWCAFLLSHCNSQSLSTLQLSMTSSVVLQTETLLPSPGPTVFIPLTAVTPQHSFSESAMFSSVSETNTGLSQTLLISKQTDNNTLVLTSSTPLLSKTYSSPILQSSTTLIEIEETAAVSPTISASKSMQQISTIMTASTDSQTITPSSSSIQLSSPSLSLTVPSMTTPNISLSPSKTLNSVPISPPDVMLSPSVHSLVEPSSSLKKPLPTATDKTMTSPSMLPNIISSEDSVMLSTPSQTEIPTIDTVGAGMKTEVIIGVIIAITLFAVILLAVVSLSCYICCRTKKYEYNTGNEYRITVQQWKHNSDHYTANRSESASLSSSRGSSFMSSFGLKPKARARYGSSPADRVTTVVNPEFFYSTPL